jgi:hypothetical protein
LEACDHEQTKGLSEEVVLAVVLHNFGGELDIGFFVALPSCFSLPFFISVLPAIFRHIRTARLYAAHFNRESNGNYSCRG